MLMIGFNIYLLCVQKGIKKTPQIVSFDSQFRLSEEETNLTLHTCYFQYLSIITPKIKYM